MAKYSIDWIDSYWFNVRCFSIDFLAIECCYLLVPEKNNKLFPLQTTIFFFGRNDAFSVCLRFSSAFSIRFSSQVIILFKNRICAVSSDFWFSFSQYILIPTLSIAPKLKTIIRNTFLNLSFSRFSSEFLKRFL